MAEHKVAIKVEHLDKVFKLPHEKTTSIKSALISGWRKSRSYEMQKALQDVTLEIKKGEFFGIVGRNGSGKSTLLKILAGIYVPTRGSIQINGSLTPFIELGVGFNPELTGRENVFLNGALLGFNRKQMNAMYDDIVEFAELERFMDQKLKNYSSGMQVRLAFSIAIRAKSDILLIDEVLAVGDLAFQEKSFDIFRNIKKEGRTVVFVSHDLNSIKEFCDRVAIIDNSKLVEAGKAVDVVMNYEAIVAEDNHPTEHKGENNSRPGGGICSILKVDLLDAHNKSVPYIKEKSAFSIDVTVSASKDMDVVIGIGISDDKGVNLIGPNTEEDDYNVVLKSGVPKHVRASFDKNLLVPGSYSITAGIFRKKSGLDYDYFENAVRFKVLGNKRHGKINIRPNWSVN